MFLNDINRSRSRKVSSVSQQVKPAMLSPIVYKSLLQELLKEVQQIYTDQLQGWMTIENVKQESLAAALLQRWMIMKNVKQESLAAALPEWWAQVKPEGLVELKALGHLGIGDLSRVARELVQAEQSIATSINSTDTWKLKYQILEKIRAEKEQSISNMQFQHPENEITSFEIFYQMGVMLGETSQPENAIIYFDEAIKCQEDSWKAWYGRGLCLKDLNQWRLAVISFENALSLNSSDQHVFNVFAAHGTCLSNLHIFEKAIVSYDAALEFEFSYQHVIWFNRSNSALKSHNTGQHTPLTQKHPELLQRGYPGQIASLTIGLTYCPADTHPLGHGILQRDLGNAHWNYARSQSIPRIYWQKALTAYNASLTVLTEDYPEERLETLQKLIRTHLALGDIPAARQHQTQGIKLFEQLRQIAPNKTTFESKYSNLSRTEIDLLIGEHKPQQALEQAEFYKNRTLTWILDDWQQPILSPSYIQMRSLLQPSTAILYWHLSDDALTTFILTPENPDPIVLNTDRRIQAFKLEQLIEPYKDDYKTYRELPKETKAIERNNHPWRQQLPQRIDRLTEILNIPTIASHLTNIQTLILVPHRDLHLLPIHACFPDRTCTYLPSLQIGLNQPTRNPSVPTLLNIDDPEIPDQSPLIYSRLESAIVRTLIPTHTHPSPAQATHDQTLTALNQPHSIFHFSGHGSYDEHRPENSAIGLTDQPLTAKQIAQLNLTPYALISLAACETGITGKNTIATEYISLASACLKARAGNVLSTLWQVNELSSTWLIIRFYQAYLSGKSPAQALAIAQTWLKTLTYSDLIPWVKTLQQQENLGNRWQKELKTQEQFLHEEMGTMGAQHRPYAHPFHWSGYIITGRG